jgi:hypothetical protein
MDNSRILNKLLAGKFHGRRPVGRQKQDGLLIAAECKRMEETKREGTGISGGELLKRPGPNAGCCTNEVV